MSAFAPQARPERPDVERPWSACQHASPSGPAALRASLQDDHPIATLFDEHRLILAHLARLAEMTAEASGDAYGPRTRAELEELDGLAADLIEAEPHHQREELVLFPALRALGIHGPPELMEHEHVRLRALKHALRDLVQRSLAGGRNLVPELCATAEVLSADLRAHIAMEDEVLFPLALRAIRAPSDWAELRRRSDAIGYCRAPARASRGDEQP